jgi:hypothetical protein
MLSILNTEAEIYKKAVQRRIMGVLFGTLVHRYINYRATEISPSPKSRAQYIHAIKNKSHKVKLNHVPEYIIFANKMLLQQFCQHPVAEWGLKSPSKSIFFKTRQKLCLFIN